jgi:PIN domain nuclease of toxin-antitoxin system
MPYLLDICAILFIAGNTTDLSPATLKVIDEAPPGEVRISAVSVAEPACLQERGKITLK